MMLRSFVNHRVRRCFSTTLVEKFRAEVLPSFNALPAAQRPAACLDEDDESALLLFASFIKDNDSASLKANLGPGHHMLALRFDSPDEHSEEDSVENRPFSVTWLWRGGLQNCDGAEKFFSTREILDFANDPRHQALVRLWRAEWFFDAVQQAAESADASLSQSELWQVWLQHSGKKPLADSPSEEEVQESVIELLRENGLE
ncbi:MAG: hypothetical protein MHM6MM_007051 [Cercozoa sp. M6MM]